MTTGPGREFIESLAASLKVSADHLYKTKRGRYQCGTWAHWQIGVSALKMPKGTKNVLRNATRQELRLQL
jgi:hypothetical protein